MFWLYLNYNVLDISHYFLLFPNVSWLCTVFFWNSTNSCFFTVVLIFLKFSAWIIQTSMLNTAYLHKQWNFARPDQFHRALQKTLNLWRVTVARTVVCARFGTLFTQAFARKTQGEAHLDFLAGRPWTTANLTFRGLSAPPYSTYREWYPERHPQLLTAWSFLIKFEA